MKKLFLLMLLVSCSGCGLLAANPRGYTYPYPHPHPCVYPCEQDRSGHRIYRVERYDFKNYDPYSNNNNTYYEE